MGLRERLSSRSAGDFGRSVGVLVTGSVLSQVVVALALPVATRLYSPVEFSVFAVFSAVLAVVAVAACLRLDIAIPMPGEDADGANLLALALGASVVVAAVLAIATLSFSDAFAATLERPELRGWLWMLPLAVLLAGFQSAVQFWFIRRRDFHSLSVARVAQSVTGASVQLGLGALGAGWWGLACGQLANLSAGVAGLGWRAWRQDRGALSGVERARLGRMLSRYERFPKYSTLEALSNSAGMQVPVILIAALSPEPGEAGHVALAVMAVQAPMGLLGTAIGQVYLSRAPDAHRERLLGAFTASVCAGLLKSGAGPFLMLAIVAPFVFPTIFGSEWERAGVLATWMTPWFLAQFLASPVSMALHVCDRQRTAMTLQVAGLALRTGAVLGAYLIFDGFLSEAYALSGWLFYSLCLVIVLRVVSAPSGAAWSGVRAAMPLILGWAAGGIALLFAFRWLAA